MTNGRFIELHARWRHAETQAAEAQRRACAARCRAPMQAATREVIARQYRAVADARLGELMACVARERAGLPLL